MYGITFSAVQEFVMLWDDFMGIAVYQKNRRCAIAYSSYGTSPIMCFCLGIAEHLIPLVPPGECHCNMDDLKVSSEISQNCYVLFKLSLRTIRNKKLENILHFMTILKFLNYSKSKSILNTSTLTCLPSKYP